MYLIMAMKGDGSEYSQVARFRSIKEAKRNICKIAAELEENLEDGWTIKTYMGIHQFAVHPPSGEVVIYYITVD